MGTVYGSLTNCSDSSFDLQSANCSQIGASCLSQLKSKNALVNSKISFECIMEMDKEIWDASWVFPFLIYNDERLYLFLTTQSELCAKVATKIADWTDNMRQAVNPKCLEYLKEELFAGMTDDHVKSLNPLSFKYLKYVQAEQVPLMSWKGLLKEQVLETAVWKPESTKEEKGIFLNNHPCKLWTKRDPSILPEIRNAVNEHCTHIIKVANSSNQYDKVDYYFLLLVFATFTGSSIQLLLK